MRLLVTGGAGFIGSHYVRSLLDGAYPGYEDADVVIVDKLTYAGNTANLPMEHPRLRFVRADVCDRHPLTELLHGCDAVVHFAAESHVDRSLRDGRRFMRTNVLGVQNLLECCLQAGVSRIVHVSTDEVYGPVLGGSCAEGDLLRPTSPYAVSKAAGDLLVLSYHRVHGMDTVISRCANNYGTHQFVEKVIPLFVTNLLDGRHVPLYGDGMHVREWLHVDDHCRAIQLALSKGRAGEIYNIGGDTALTNRELTAMLLELCGRDWSYVRHVEDRKGHDRRYALDDTKIHKELGFQPRIPVRDGLMEVVRWYRDNRSWWSPRKRASRHQERRLPAQC